MNLFPDSTSITLDSKLTVFDVREIPDELQAVSLYLIIERGFGVKPYHTLGY